MSLRAENAAAPASQANGTTGPRPGSGPACAANDDKLTPPAPSLLSFDVEEYFHVEAAAGRLTGDDWPGMQQRLAPAIDRILALLAEFGVQATFFVLGWVGRHERGVVQRIADAGHEIASHGMSHAMLTRLTPAQFRQELTDSRKLLEDISGSDVLGFRAPTFSVLHATAWALDELEQAGYAYDSSVFPVRHDRYGVPDAPIHMHWALGPGRGNSSQGPCGGTGSPARGILEIPPLTLRLLGANVPVGGGGYLRLLPVRLIQHAIGRCRRAGEPAMIYLHPWELDAGQPALPMGRVARLRHRIGLSKTEAKLRWLLAHNRFGSVRAHLPALAARAKQTYLYGR